MSENINSQYDFFKEVNLDAEGNIGVSIVGGVSSEDIQGYYGLLSGFYFGGTATETVIDEADVNNWVDVELVIDSEGLFDNRPTSMKEAQSVGHDNDGSTGNPIVFKLEGLDIKGFANFRASMSFEPEEDEGQLESRLLFNRHSGTSPSEDFSIEEVSLSMQNGADIDYVTNKKKYKEWQKLKFTAILIQLQYSFLIVLLTQNQLGRL